MKYGYFPIHFPFIISSHLFLSLCRLGAMDSLHVSGQQTSSKTSSRSTSPCRPRTEQDSHHAHHTKTLSHGSADSNKVSHFYRRRTLQLSQTK